jgi:hypothetical protein
MALLKLALVYKALRPVLLELRLGILLDWTLRCLTQLCLALCVLIMPWLVLSRMIVPLHRLILLFSRCVSLNELIRVVGRRVRLLRCLRLLRRRLLREVVVLARIGRVRGSVGGRRNRRRLVVGLLLLWLLPLLLLLRLWAILLLLFLTIRLLLSLPILALSITLLLLLVCLILLVAGKILRGRWWRLVAPNLGSYRLAKLVEERLPSGYSLV